VADPVVLSNKTDGVVLVFEAGSTRFGAAGQTMANLEQAGAAVVGAILNQVKEGRGGYYYHHHYRYYSPNGVSANGHQPAGQPLPAAKPRRLPRWLPFGKE
jgi:Mrp family chromosome partitioning ATPase